jgi:hypothetical protein
MIDDKSTSYKSIIDIENLYKAYRKSKQGKGFSKSSQRFQVAALDGIYQIKRMLETRSYKISKYKEFVIYEPKERVIMSCSFKDKIVQHSLCDNVLLPKLKYEFIGNNFAGQINKGTLYGLDWLKVHMILAYNKYGYDCWIVKADIRKFFYNINHDTLKDIIGYFIEESDTYWLCEKFVDSTEGVGLPLGNQVSQVYALMYLSGLDHFITGELGVKYYGRYMDDVYLIVESKEYAKWCLNSIQLFIDTLHLELNSKTQLVPFKNGIKFCGFHTYITDTGKAIRKLTNEKKRAARKKFKKMSYLVHKGKLSREKFLESYNSWKNHISHGNCIKLGYEMDNYINELLENRK